VWAHPDVTDLPKLGMCPPFLPMDGEYELAYSAPEANLGGRLDVCVVSRNSSARPSPCAAPGLIAANWLSSFGTTRC
jgi:hypothetical protein